MAYVRINKFSHDSNKTSRRIRQNGMLRSIKATVDTDGYLHFTITIFRKNEGGKQITKCDCYKIRIKSTNVKMET